MNKLEIFFIADVTFSHCFSLEFADLNLPSELPILSGEWLSDYDNP